ncbi:MAG: 16S rRNA (adenine(1518)-N(6)/adenine(1519)-N(6))-dimethyltransferase RsmA [Actinomycetota bacterium]|nr:16S rRNA (adenine(1518)-N(6)/adenine(1519)-N(6))-dimethyltransferase RsmA [Actinomycetota bacterium]
MSNYISSPSVTARILKNYGIKLKKSLGQNFLIDTNNAKKIVNYAGIDSCDTVLEIGSGIGSLTEILMGEAKEVVCIEIDKKLAAVFEEIFRDRSEGKIQLIQADALKLDYGLIAGKYKITKMVSNLPYSIAAHLLLKILTETEDIKRFFVTIQKDIAERLLASAGDKNYNSYTLKSNFLADFDYCFQISRNCFFPRPFIDSAVIEVNRKDRGIQEGKNFNTEDFFNFLNSCFLHRRKMLVNSLSRSDKYCHKLKLIIKLLSEIGRSKDVRAEELYLKDYIFLFKGLNDL